MLQTRTKLMAAIGLVAVPVIDYYAPRIPEILAAATAVALIWFGREHVLTVLGLRRPRSIFHTILMGVAIGVAMVLINRLALTPALEALWHTKRDLTRFDALRGHPEKLAILLLTIWVTAGVCEEIIYRAYLITRFERLFGETGRAPYVAAVLSAIVFGMAHWYQDSIGMFVTGTFGIVLGVLFVLNGRNLWMNVIAHGVADTVSLTLICFSLDRQLDIWAHTLFR